MKIQLGHSFEEIISVENLLEAWREFLRGKRGKRDVQEFSTRLMDNIFSLYDDLKNHTYKHGNYQAFKINDPKPRDIHKASVRDRLLHHAVHRKLYPFFDKIFIKTLSSGIDFLGWVHFPDHRVLRTKTKRRMLKRISESPKSETINSYLGLLRHGNTYKLRREVVKSTSFAEGLVPNAARP